MTWGKKLRSLAMIYVAAVLAAAIVLLAPPARAQEAGASLSADTAYIGERFTFTLTAPRAQGRRAVFPTPAAGDTVFGDLWILGGRDTLRDDPDVIRVAYEVTTFALDSAVVPSLPIHMVGEQDTVLLRTPALVLPVRSIVPDTATTVRDLAPLFAFGRPVWPWVLLGMSLLCLAALLGYVVWKRRQEDDVEPFEPPPPPEPPGKEALRRLHELEARFNPGAPDEVKPFYVELSDTLRTYLHRRIDAPALEMTTAELMEHLRRHPRMPSGSAERARNILVLADLAKFADFRPSEDEGRITLRDTYLLVENIEEYLRPAPVTQEESETAM